ncbi:MAG: tetratricopeptide repeat protein [Bacteroidia bacterium]
MNNIKLKIGLLICMLVTLSAQVAFSQNAYEQAWKALDNADLFEAITKFEDAAKSGNSKEEALVALTILNTHINKEEQAGKYFQQYFKTAKDPYPALYSLWFQNGVLGGGNKKTKLQMELMEKVYEDPRNKGRFDGDVLYRLGMHEVSSQKKTDANKFFAELKHLPNWQLLGPFDNVMNSGFDKDFGALTHPESDAVFESRYGAEVSWFKPEYTASDAYFVKDLNFLSSGSIVYAQTFVKSDETQDVLLNFGYSGSLKLWVNDQEVYSEAERRSTIMDYYKVKCSLQKGYNRILIQLGEFDENYPTFIVRISDRNHNLLELESKAEMQAYSKKTQSVEIEPYFAVEGLKKKMAEKPNDRIYRYLLAMAYRRSKELNEAEDILKKEVETTPENFFALINIIRLYSISGNNTDQNKYYEAFKSNYPEDRFILENEIKENISDDKEKARELIDTYLKLYPNDLKQISYDIIRYSMNEDYKAIIKEIERYYDRYPENADAVKSWYGVVKQVKSDPNEANRVLEKYLKNNYNYQLHSILMNNYIEDGKVDKAIGMIEDHRDLIFQDIDQLKTEASLYVRKEQYEDAIDLYKYVIKSRPSDYRTYADIAQMYQILNKPQKAIEYYREALRFYPFSFENNEKIRELKEQTLAMDLIDDIEPEDMIKDYEENFKTDLKRPYEIVFDHESAIIFNSLAMGRVHSYVICLKDESAIEDWQQVSFSSGGGMRMNLQESKTIKKDGSKISAERNGGTAVFTQLEPGDYIYIKFTQEQSSGGKSSKFISDKYTLNSTYPSYKSEFNLFVEDGVKVNDTILNSTLKPVVTTKEGFTRYQWAVESPEVIKEESYMLPSSDISENIHLSLDYNWSDIVAWYNDLTKYQMEPDYTIDRLADELFAEKNLSDMEKAKTIYDFVCKNIQYSSIDFRQGSHIPQKASKVYLSRLGDCKDVSTLYASLANKAGLDADLVLINTRNNGQKNVLLPSLNFNHCIVKVNIDEEPIYLELTDQNLPFGHLYHYHEGAAILEITDEQEKEGAKLTYLKPNTGYQNNILRATSIKVGDSRDVEVKASVTKTGTMAAGSVERYFNADTKERRERISKSIGGRVDQPIKLGDLTFDKLEQRADSSIYHYDYEIENALMKIGSFRSLKLPFMDVLGTLTIFDNDEARSQDFNFMRYETTDVYEDVIDVELSDTYSFAEVPENVHLEYNGTVYDLKFLPLDERKVKIIRTYTVNRENVMAGDFEKFQDFITKLVEAENTHLVFK